jgi:hypothetical protein
MVAFRRRINAFFADPRTAGLSADLRPPSPRPASTTANALNSRLAQTMARLGMPAAPESLRLRKSLTVHDGRVVAITGDSSALEPGEKVRVVTMTTTVLDTTQMRSETTVLVFELEPGT